MKYLTQNSVLLQRWPIGSQAVVCMLLTILGTCCSTSAWGQIRTSPERPSFEPIVTQVRPQPPVRSLAQLTSAGPQELGGPQEDESDSDKESSTIAPLQDVVPQWPSKSIREIQIDIRDGGKRVPEDRSYELNRFGGPADRAATNKVYAWAAPDIRYQPLYFEDVPLERYGQTLPPYRQSFASTVHFFKSFVLTPHQMRHDLPWSCDHPLGFCRPGNEVPYTLERKYFGRVR